MNNNEKNTLAAENKNNGMVSLLEGTQQLEEQHTSSVLKVLNDPLNIGLPKSSKKMTNVCGIRMRYEQNLNKSTLHSLIVLNPECQIKILEKNLKFLFQDDSTYNYFQIKSNQLNLITGSTDYVNEFTNNITEPKPLLINSSEPTFNQKIIKHEFPTQRKKGLEETFDSNFSDKKERSGQNSELSSSMPIDTKRTKNKRVLSSAAQTPLRTFFDKSDPEKYDYNSKDTDNQYEFTLEQEKIVSFVCSTSPPRKQTNMMSPGTEFSNDKTLLSDNDSESNSKLWTSCDGESDSLSDSVSNSLCESNKRNTTLGTDYLPKFQQMTGSLKLLWHPPSSLSHDCLDQPNSKQITHPSVITSLNATESVPDVRVSSDSVQRKMESSFSRETTLFRETSLRGCYSMENIVKNIIPPQVHVQQELKKVRESIFAAVRSQQNPDDLVSDSILSILDICKSWLKLSSHLKGKAFMDILENSGTNVSILNDFLQWQCVSRVFIDKMINTLHKITPTINGSHVKSTLNDLGSLTPTDIKNFVISPVLLNKHSSVNSISTFQIENDLSSPKCEINPNKNWKQRRFFLDQPKQLTTEPKKIFRPNHLASNTYNNCSQTHSHDMLHGQGDPPLSYNSEPQFCQINHTSPATNIYSGQGDVNFPPNCCSILHSNVSFPYRPDKNTNIPCVSKSLKHLVRERGGTKSYETPVTNNITNSFPTLGLPTNPHSQPTTPSFTVPPFYDSQMCYSSCSNYQFNPSQFNVKQNPIQCTDSDVIEKCTKSSYMKPGSYNIPEKPIGFQKVINNNIPIEDSPVVGVPFLFSGVQEGIRSPKSLTAETKMPIEDDGLRKSEEKWKAAMTSAETFRESLMACKADSGPNLKLSDTVSLKTHFLLSDEFSQGSSSNELKLSSESEDLSPCDRASPAMDVSIVEAQVKTSDWLMQSFNKAVLENRDNLSEFGVEDICRANFMSEKLVNNKNYEINSHHNSSCSLNSSKNFFQFRVNNKVLNPKPELSVIDMVEKKSESNDGSFTGKKTNRNNHKLHDDLSLSSLFDHKSSLFRKKAKSIFKRAITNPITTKLEDILNCICSTEVSSLIKFDCKSEKEISKLEIKVRCPLYLQAMRCKLANHSYDTLDQALSDFQKYFMDIRNRNKGDKQSTDAVGALEHLFLDLVEKHFGSCQPTPQYFGLRDLSSTVKHRKAKKVSRRC